MYIKKVNFLLAACPKEDMTVPWQCLPQASQPLVSELLAYGYQ